MRYLKTTARIACAAAMVIATLTVPAKAKSLKLAYAWASNQTTVRVIGRTFEQKVKEYAKDAISISSIGPDAIPPLEQFEPLQSGIVQLLYSHPAYHSGVSTLGLSEAGIQLDPAKWRSEGIFDVYDSYYQSIGVKVIMIAPLGNKGFRFVTSQPVEGKVRSFDGMKVRTNAAYTALIEKLGGTPVPLSGGQIYSSLQSGVIDAAPWATTGMMDHKLHEVATHVLWPDFGSLNNWMYMNLDTWNSLNLVTQQAIERAAKETEIYALDEMTCLGKEELGAMLEAGLSITRMNDNEAQNVDAWMAESLWALASKTSVELTEEIRNKAKAAGLAH